MNVVDFRNILCIGYFVEFFIFCVPLLAIQAYNNDMIRQDF